MRPVKRQPPEPRSSGISALWGSEDANPYYEDEAVTLYHGSCLDLLPGLTGACLVTSPPYNVGIAYDTHNDRLPLGEYEALMVDVCALMPGVLAAENGRAWVNVAPVVAMGEDDDAFRYPLLVKWGAALLDAGMKIRDIGSWSSQRGSGTAWGSWQSPSAPNQRGDWEAFVCAHPGPWPREEPIAMAGWRDTVGNWPALTSNVWEIRPEHRDEHPAPFPEEFAARAIRLSTWPGEVVLDPFAGSGTTLLAAKHLGRRAIGIELSERYCEIAASQLAQGALDFGGAA